MSAGLDPMLRLLGMLPSAARGEMVRMYGELLAAQVDALDDALRQPDAGTIALLHKLAGSAAMMQDHDLSQPARAMERALREDRVEQAQERLPALKAAAARTLAALQSL